MLSKERVLEALRVHLDASADCEDCPYHDDRSGCNSIDMFAEVQELLMCDSKKEGLWVPHPFEREWDVCSVCGTGCKRREYENGTVTEQSYHYCPWCGARLE